MNRRARLAGPLLIAILALGGCCRCLFEGLPLVAKEKPMPLMYPLARASDYAEILHGARVADPYRWMESIDSMETRGWIEAENSVTEAFLSATPAREKIRARLTELWNYEKFGIPFREGGDYFYFHNDGLQNQNVLYRATEPDAAGEPVLDPNTFSQDGTVALGNTSISDDGTKLAYGTSTSGSDWREFFVLDLTTLAPLPDRLEWIKFSGAAWDHAGEGFYYSRYPQPQPGEALGGANFNHKVYYHRLGTAQSEDRLIYERPDHKDWNFGARVTEDGRYLAMNVSQGGLFEDGFFYKDLGSTDAPVVELLNKFDAEYSFIGNEGSVFYFQTNLGAPNYRVIAIDVSRPDPAQWREIIAQSDDALQGAGLVGRWIIAEYLHDATSRVRVFDREGRHQYDVELPGLGTASGFGGRRDQSETFYSFTAYETPNQTYRLDLATGRSTLLRRDRVDFDPSQFESKQVFYAGKDGTPIPMTIVHKKGLALDGNNPTYLYGYGGFNISLAPRFAVSQALWLEQGGVYAVPNLRGGGEYGREWHEAGTKERKQNVFDDFIAAAEWLIANKYTSTPRLAISGRSNGGLLVGACMTQRPDLYGACLAGVGVMDMLRFHKFTIGWAWTADFGSPDDAAMFEAIRKYSPYHNLRPGVHYPPTLVTTADHDDRVFPAHSFKFAARLQACQGGPAPTLIKIQTKAGHGAGRPTAMVIDDLSDEYAFLARALAMHWN